jgi:hypothetical protein
VNAFCVENCPKIREEPNLYSSRIVPSRGNESSAKTG